MPVQLNKYVCKNDEVLLYTGKPNLNMLENLAVGPGDLWHSSLDQGFKNLFLEVQYQTAVFWWFLNDFDNLSKSVSWRINPSCFVVRESIWTLFGGFPTDYNSEVTSALDFGFRLLRYGGGIPLYVQNLYESSDNNQHISAVDRYMFFRKNFKNRHTYYMFLRELRNSPLREWKAFRETEKINLQKNSFPVIQKRKLLPVKRNSKISVVIPTMNRQEFTLQLLKDFENQTYPIYEAIIIDATKPGNRKEIYDQSLFNYKLITKWQTSKGSCRARNEAIYLCEGDYIIFADDDIRVLPNFVENHLRFLRTYNAEACTGLDITASSMEDDLEDLELKYSNLTERIKHAGATQHFSNANSCVKREWVGRLRGNDIRFDGGYGEDSDFGLRLLQEGAILLYNPFAINLHLKPQFGGYSDWKKESSFVGKKRKVQMWEGNKRVKYIKPVPSPTVLYGIMKSFKPNQVKEYYYKYLFLYLFKNSSESFLIKLFKLPLKILQLRKSIIYARILLKKENVSTSNNIPMLKLFTFKEYLNPQYRKIIFPLLLDLYFYEKSILNNYYFLVESLDNSDIVIIPIDINYFNDKGKNQILFEMIQMGLKIDKPVWVYSSGDYGKTLKLPVYTFRLGGFNSNLSEKTFIVPALIQDPYKSSLKKKSVAAIDKTEKPSIGFVGHAGATSGILFKEILNHIKLNLKNLKAGFTHDYQSYFPSTYIRGQILDSLVNSDLIKSNFILRRKYRAGARNVQDRQQTELEFFNNIYQNIYTFCMRGTGNFSIRLYETLACGRIPVIIETDFRFPLPWLAWSKHCIITTRENIEKDLITFHRNHTNKELKELQHGNREFWKKNLTREGYFINLFNHFKEKV